MNRQRLLPTVFASQKYYQQILGFGPIRYWPLWDAAGATAATELIAGANGTPTSVTFGTTGIGDGRQAASFDGTASRLNLTVASTLAAFNGQLGSLVVWAKVSAVGVWTDATSRRLFYLQDLGGNDRIIVQKTANPNEFNFFYQANGTNESIVVSSHSPTTWVSYALTWSKAADEVKAFINGSQTGTTQTGLGTYTDQPDRMFLGTTTAAGQDFWSGSIAHAALFTTVLTPAQILSLANPT